MGCGARRVSYYPTPDAVQKRTHLDKRIAENGGGDVRNPHAREARDAHVGEENRPGLGTGETEHLGGEDLVDVLLAEGGGEGEASEEEHDRRAEHLTEDVPASAKD